MKKINKFPKSVHNHQCLSSCYPPNKTRFHPIYMNAVHNKDNETTCDTELWKDATENIHIIDECTFPFIEPDATQHIFSLIPATFFDHATFLKKYYNINNIDECFEYINKNINISNETKTRLINLSISAFHKNIMIINEHFVIFLSELIKQKYIKIIYKNIKKYIYIDDKNKKIILKNNNNDNHKIEKINYIIKTFITKGNITKFLIKYFKQKDIDYDESTENLHKILIEFINYLTNIVEISINK